MVDKCEEMEDNRETSACGGWVKAAEPEEVKHPSWRRRSTHLLPR